LPALQTDVRTEWNTLSTHWTDSFNRVWRYINDINSRLNSIEFALKQEQTPGVNPIVINSEKTLVEAVQTLYIAIDVIMIRLQQLGSIPAATRPYLGTSLEQLRSEFNTQLMYLRSEMASVLSLLNRNSPLEGTIALARFISVLESQSDKGSLIETTEIESASVSVIHDKFDHHFFDSNPARSYMLFPWYEHLLFMYSRVIQYVIFGSSFLIYIIILMELFGVIEGAFPYLAYYGGVPDFQGWDDPTNDFPGYSLFGNDASSETVSRTYPTWDDVEFTDFDPELFTFGSENYYQPWYQQFIKNFPRDRTSEWLLFDDFLFSGDYPTIIETMSARVWTQLFIDYLSFFGVIFTWFCSMSADIVQDLIYTNTFGIGEIYQRVVTEFPFAGDMLQFSHQGGIGSRRNSDETILPTNYRSLGEVLLSHRLSETVTYLPSRAYTRNFLGAYPFNVLGPGYNVITNGYETVLFRAEEYRGNYIWIVGTGTVLRMFIIQCLATPFFWATYWPNTIGIYT
jgi:hypothetical protein